nr:M23 family metallopeptidase [Rossellomorea aquimaris]
MFRSYRSSSYGEVVFIVHDIGGQTYETVYALIRSGNRKVCTGDKVKQGFSIKGQLLKNDRAAALQRFFCSAKGLVWEKCE